MKRFCMLVILLVLPLHARVRGGDGKTPDSDMLVRGPYLQMGTPTGVTVRWRTRHPVASLVHYGTILKKPTGRLEDVTPKSEHELRIKGLKADTKYYYAIGTPTAILAGNDAEHFFLTPPARGTAKPTRIWVIGDSGTGNGNARAVRDAYYRYAGDRHTDLWLMLGDNAYDKGTDAQYQKAVFRNMYEKILVNSVLWTTRGNHEAFDRLHQTVPYYDIFTMPTHGEAGGEPSGEEAYYSFDYAHIHFVCLDSHRKPRGPGLKPMLQWLQADLEQTDQDWLIAFWHHPPYSKGSHDSDRERPLVVMRERVLPLLEAHGVDLVLTGHSHSYERSMLLNGHYGPSSEFAANPEKFTKNGGDGRANRDGAYRKPGGLAGHQGTVYAVCGCSGKTTRAPMNHPVMIQFGEHRGLRELGSMVLDIDAHRMDAIFLDRRGKIRDSFTILKEKAS